MRSLGIRGRGFDPRGAFLVSLFFVVPFFPPLLLGTVCGFTTEYLDLIDYTVYAAVRCTSMYL